MSDNSGGFGARVIGIVLLLVVALPIAFWTGKEWLLLFALVPVLGWGEISRDAAWLALVIPRRGVVVLFGWAFILLGVLAAAASAVLVLRESAQVWTWAIVSGALGGVITYLAVVRVVDGAWFEQHLYDYAGVAARNRAGRSPTGRPHSRQAFGALAGRARARELMDLRPPPFRPPGFAVVYRDIRNDIAELQIRVAEELVAADELDEALRHCAEASALRRSITGESRRADYLIAFAQALDYEAETLTLAGRIADAVAVGAEEIVGGRRLNAAFAHRGDLPVEVRNQTAGYLAEALMRQSDLLEQLGRSVEARQLLAEARDLDPT
ncbi:hypothetical protein [Nocardia sp. NPDC024068]|uniref:hypothetical protein n=1 Tax=Nocardia sp. NPDC024068 TaxID=3157197 RepID=UPI0033FD9671